MRVAAIDVGTNSIKLTVAEDHPETGIRVLRDASTVTGLGKGVDTTRSLGDEAAMLSLEVIAGYVASARELGAESIRIVATSAMRDAANGPAFARMVEERTGVALQVISGEQEGRLSFAAVARDPKLGLPDPQFAVVDTGGGSTEVSIGQGGEVLSVVSMRLGVVRLTERFLKADPPSVADVANAALYVEDCLSQSAGGSRPGRVVGVGGTAVNLARIILSVPTTSTQAVHGARIPVGSLADCLDRLSRMTIADRRAVVGLEPKRAATIVAGNIIIERAVVALGARELAVSTRGLRYGLIYEMLGIG